MCNLTANAETRKAATRGGGLQAVVRLLSDEDGECSRYAAICVCNIANDHQMQVRMEECSKRKGRIKSSLALEIVPMNSNSR